jgi:hypothetical protein
MSARIVVVPAEQVGGKGNRRHIRSLSGLVLAAQV